MPDGRLNETLFRNFSYRSLVEQAVKTRALVKLYRGQGPRYAYFDGHSTGGCRYPLCVYPQKAVWDGFGSPKLAGNCACR